MSRKILVVEDLAGCLQAIKRVLWTQFGRASVEVIEANNALAAAIAIDSAYDEGLPFDAAVLDIHVPKDEGGDEEHVDFETVKLFRTRMPNAKWVHLTAYADASVTNERLKEMYPNEVEFDAHVVSRIDAMWPEKLLERLI